MEDAMDFRMGKGTIGKMQARTSDKDIVREYLTFNIKVMMLAKDGKPQTKEEMENRFEEYFLLCAEKGLNPTVERVTDFALGYHRDSIHAIEHGEYSRHLTDVVKAAKSFISNYDALLAQNGKMPQSVYIFRGKNFYDMKDVQEIQAGPIQSTDPKNPDEIMAAIPDMIDYGNPMER